MKKLFLFAISIALITLTGCITIIEKYKIHANGTGTMEYIIDMSEMYEMMASFSDSADAMETNSIDASIQEALPDLKNLDGISNIELTGDLSRYIAAIRFDFKNAEALNKAMAMLFEGSDNVTGTEKYVEIKGKTFTRFGETSKEFNKEDILGSQGLDSETMKSMLESMKYKISVEFDKKIKNVKTLGAITREEKSVTVETNFSDLFDNYDLMKTIIKTK